MQNTNDGAGVKTGHLQNDAVTTEKILDLTVGNNDLANGAVNDTKITGPISASKISSAGLDADSVDGMHAADLAPVIHGHGQSDVTGLETALAGKADTAHNHDGIYQKKYANVIVVAKSGGDFGTPAAALSSINDASESNPYLVKVMPGTYVGAVVLRDYVDVEGSGANVTKLVSESLGSGYYTLLANVTAQHNEVRDLTIEQTANGGADLTAVAVNISQGTLTLRRVNIVASSTGLSNGVWFNNCGQLTLIDSLVSITSDGTSNGIDMECGTLNALDSSVKVVGTGTGIRMYNGVTASIDDCDISGATSGINPTYNNNVRIKNSDISGATNGVLCSGNNNTLKVIDSRLAGTSNAYSEIYGGAFFGSAVQLEGAVQAGSGYKCLGCYDEDFDPLP